MGHNQTWVKVNTPVDVGIAEVVRVLNDIPGLQTLDSCQGEPGQRPAHIYFQYGDWRQLGTLLFDRLGPAIRAKLPDDAHVTCEVFNGSSPTGRITFSPEATPMVASILNAVAYDRP